MVYFSLLQAEQSDLCADRHGRGAGEVEAVQIFPLAGRGILVAGKAARVGAVEADGADHGHAPVEPALFTPVGGLGLPWGAHEHARGVHPQGDGGHLARRGQPGCVHGQVLLLRRCHLLPEM